MKRVHINATFEDPNQTRSHKMNPSEDASFEVLPCQCMFGASITQPTEQPPLEPELSKGERESS